MASVSDRVGDSSPVAKRRRLNENEVEQIPLPTPAAENAVHQNAHQYAGARLQDNARAQFGDSYHNYYYPTPQSHNDSFEVLMKSLLFDRMDARLNNIRAALAKTCTWLFKHKDFLEWQDDSQIAEHHGFLWIKGKPGSGKSTIMKLAFQQAKRKRSDGVIISYFFNARAPGDLEKSSLGLYRSFVHQLIKAIPSLKDSFVERFGSKEKNGIVEDWTSNELQDFIHDTILTHGNPYVQVFVDALDEGDEDDIRQLIMFLEQLAQHAVDCQIKFRVCLSSRHYPHISISAGLELIVEDQLGHTEDLQQYISQLLHIDQSEDMQNLRAEVLHKSAGIFLWVTLVVPMLKTKFDKGDSVGAVMEHLKTIPSKLDSLFADILTRNLDDIESSVVLLQWVLFATRSLNVPELYGLIWHSRESSPDTESMPLLEPRHVKLFLLNCSRGLVEVTASDPPNVQFIHETVRTFLLSNDGIGKIAPHLAENLPGLSHDMLKNTCWKLIQRFNSDRYAELQEKTQAKMFKNGRVKSPDKVLREQIMKDHPILCYAVDNLLLHANKAQSNDCCQKDFIFQWDAASRNRTDLLAVGVSERFFKNWRLLHNVLAKYATQSYSHSVSSWYILADQNLLALAQRCDIPIKSSPFDRYGTALQAACANSHEDMAALLLSRNVDVNELGGEYKHALAAAHRKQNKRIVGLLRDYGAKLPDDLAIQMLHTACEASNVRTVEFILETGISADSPRGARDSWYCPLFDRIYFGAPPRYFYKDMCRNATNLCGASRAGQSDIIRLLVRYGADTNRICCRGNALYHCMLFGNSEACDVLKEVGAELHVNLENPTSLLLGVARSTQSALMEHILRMGVDINACSNGTTVLHKAAALRDCAVIDMLLNYGADLHKAEANGGSLLCDATCNGYFGPGSQINVVRKLIDCGADVNLPGRSGDLPLESVRKQVFGDNKELIDLLVAAGARTQRVNTTSTRPSLTM